MGRTKTSTKPAKQASAHGTFFLTDVECFNSNHRTDTDRAEIRRVLQSLINDSCVASDTPVLDGAIGDSGDGVHIIFPATISKSDLRVMADLYTRRMADLDTEPQDYFAFSRKESQFKQLAKLIARHWT